jgi:succinate dehydrogenase/fumarate reductase cytochrome b subunit
MNQPVNPYAAPTARVDESRAADAAPALWNPAAGGAWSLLLSVAFGAWINLQNWKALEEEERVSTSRIWFIVSVIVVVLVILLPMGRLLGLPYLIVWYFAQNKPQIKYVKERFGEDYPHRPWLKVLLLAFLVIVICSMAVGMVGVFMMRR